MTILITGATGLIGKAIVKQCHNQGVSVHYLTTSKEKIQNKIDYKGFFWNPASKEIDITCFNGVDAIINLAGVSISNRWTKTYKQQILSSRLQALQFLKTTIENENIKIKQLISASAIGIYPDSRTKYYEESYEGYSSSFLGEVTSQWEKAADSFETLDILVAKIRIGLVLDDKEGALPQLLKPIKIGFGAALGSGSQWQSWIHIEDLARIYMHTLEHNLDGVFNAVAPNPVSNQEFTKAIAKTLKKPLFLPNIPSVFLKLLLGEMYLLLMESQRVCSKKIEIEGFDFKYPNLMPALENLLEV